MNEEIKTMEWLDTNDFGSYASSTISGAHTRKYHGLLVAKLANPAGKFVLLSKVEDTLCLGDQEVLLTAHRYPGVTVPNPLPSVKLTLDKVPTFNYRIGTIALHKEIALLSEANTVLIKYSVSTHRTDAKLRVKPLLAYRGVHALTAENISLRVRTFPAEKGFLVSPYDGMPPFYMQCNADFEFFPSPTWYRHFEYEEEARRGFECHEDLFSPGMFEIPLGQEETEILFSASTEPQGVLTSLWDREMASRRSFKQKLRGSPFQKSLHTAASQFVITGSRGAKSVTAGYHWFVEWGRDAMISLPGLLLTKGDTNTYIAILKTFAGERQRGIVPNFLGETPAQNAYNSADAGLWLAWAVQQYRRNGGDIDPLKGVIAECLADLYRCYRDGTDHGIGMMENGLLSVGSPWEQVTWMDAMVNGHPVTPRSGAPVEINALWYNFVSFIAEEGAKLGIAFAEEASELAPRIKTAFNDAFWIEGAGYLADLWQASGKDISVRPNQIFAVSLPFSPLDEEKKRRVVDKVTRELLTPLGLRTLSPYDPRYLGVYEGGPEARDRAYHNGTVWPWLLAHYAEAVLAVYENKNEASALLTPCIAALEKHLGESGVGSISEIFDGDAPHKARGCISQAWSVAEVLRLLTLIES